MEKRGDTFWQNIIMLTISFILLIFVGITGYSILLGWDWLDALYMTFISFSTVGFSEIGQLNIPGRIFTMFIVTGGLILIAMLSATVTSWFVSNELLATRRKLKMRKKIEMMQGHTILCGAGDTGINVVKEFVHNNRPLIVIEENDERVSYLREHYPELPVVNGDATKDEILQEANIKNAEGLITALPDDADNLFVVVSAKDLNPNMMIVARSLDTHTENKLYRAGANYVISPNIVEGLRMAAVMLRPTVVSFLEIMMSSDEKSFRMEEVPVPAGSNLHNKTLMDAEIPQRTGLTVIALKRGASSKWFVNPSSSTVLHENDRLIVLGDTDKIDKLCAFLQQ
ncbi:MAG: potassium channel protein [Caldithrix sp.]|nr:potassium channel protein [Caldithrix sp.]